MSDPNAKPTWNWNHDFDDHLSDLSDLSESEDEQPALVEPPAPEPIQKKKSTRQATQKATETSKKRVGKGALPLTRPPRSVTFPVSALFDYIKQGTIDLDPEYQRGVVWNDKKQSDLIGSIFGNYYVPQVLFTVVRESDGGEKRVCIDGKQRLTSICRFMDGKIPYKNSENRNVYFMNPKGSKHKVLPAKLQANFKNKQISCVEYDELTPEEEREIFQRVQLGVVLSPADRLPAINSPYAELVRACRRRIESKSGFSGYLDWGKARGKDFQALGQSVYLVVYGKQPAKADPTPARLEKFLMNMTPAKNFAELQADAINMVDIYCRIAGDRRLGAPMREDLTPNEFTMALYLTWTYRKKLSETQLSDAMSRMRADFHANFRGKKQQASTASAIFKHLLNFVKKTLPELIPKLKNTPGSVSAFDYDSSAAHNECDTDIEMSEPQRVSAGKRKRTVAPVRHDEDADSESDCEIVFHKKKQKESAEEVSSKPKTLLGGTRKSAKTVVKKPLTKQSVSVAPATSAAVPPASAASTSSRKPLPNRASGHQKTPLNSTPGPSDPSGSVSGRSPAIASAAPTTVPRASHTSVKVAPATYPPGPVSIPVVKGSQPTSTERNVRRPSASEAIPKPSFNKVHPAPPAKAAPKRWPPLGSSGAPPKSANGSANNNAVAGPSGGGIQAASVPTVQAMTTSARLKALPNEMIALGGLTGAKRGLVDNVSEQRDHRPELKRRRTGGDDLGASNIGPPAPQRRVTVQHIPVTVTVRPEVDARHAMRNTAQESPHNSRGSSPETSGSLFSRLSSPVVENVLPGIGTLSLNSGAVGPPRRVWP